MIANLRFVGHNGEISQPKSAVARTMFILDANVMLALLQNASKSHVLPKRYKDLLLTTRARNRCQWHVRARKIPINPFFAALELSKQIETRDYSSFLDYFQTFLRKVYQIDNIDPQWIKACYLDACRLMDSTFQGIEGTIGQALKYMPEIGTSNEVILHAVDSLCDWMEANTDSLTMIGGPSLFVSVSAFAGRKSTTRWCAKNCAKRHVGFYVFRAPRNCLY
jgi:hypothetical protein